MVIVFSRQPAVRCTEIFYAFRNSFISPALMTSTSAESPIRLTWQNLQRLGRGLSLTPSWELSNASQFLSSGASSSRRPMEDRIMYTKRQVWYYMMRLCEIEPEGKQAVLASEVQFEGHSTVRLKPNVVIPARKDFEVLAFWKRKRYLFQQKLTGLTNEYFSTQTNTATSAAQECSMSGAEWAAQLQRAVETWLRDVPSASKKIPTGEAPNPHAIYPTDSRHSRKHR